MVAQPGRAAVLDLLEPRFLPVRREFPNGPFLRMYDGAAYTMSMQMGVETIRIDEHFDVDMTRVDQVHAPVVRSPQQRAPLVRHEFGSEPELPGCERAVDGRVRSSTARRVRTRNQRSRCSRQRF